MLKTFIYHGQQAILSLLREVLAQLKILNGKVDKMAKTLDDVVADVTAQTTKLDSLTAFIAGLKQQIADALAGVTLPPAAQAKVDAVFAGLEANNAKIDAAMSANVPPTP